MTYLLHPLQYQGLFPQGGCPVKISVHAVATKWEVQAWPIRKHRKNWRVVPVNEPCVFVMDNVFFVHPDIMQRLKESKQDNLNQRS